MRHAQNESSDSHIAYYSRVFTHPHRLGSQRGSAGNWYLLRAGNQTFVKDPAGCSGWNFVQLQKRCPPLVQDTTLFRKTALAWAYVSTTRCVKERTTKETAIINNLHFFWCFSPVFDQKKHEILEKWNFFS